MNRLLLALLFSMLTDISIATLQENLLIYNNNECKTQDYRKGQKRPHIIIILADDMGWNDVSFHGSDQIPTPNIDALAYNGVILNNHYVSALCTPSRSSLMTGKYPIYLGMQHDVLYISEPRGLPLNEKLLPQYLKEVGYSTHIVGKWHLGYYKREYTPTYRGFDTHFGYWNGLQDYYNHIVIDPIVENDPPLQGFDMRRNLSVAWDTMGKYSTDLFTEEAVRLINAHDINDPMFLYLSHLAPHSGNQNNLLQAPTEEIAKFSYITDPARRIYAAMVSKLDQSVGEVMEALNNRKMLENSIVLFMSDNGAPTKGFLQNYGSNYPFRGTKNSPWEGGVRGVAAIWSPLIKKRQRVSNQLMSIVDWLPTLLSVAGISKTKIPKIDGRNMWPALNHGLNLREEVLINIDDINNYVAIRRDNFKYVTGETQSRFTWVGDSGRSPNENRPPYGPEVVLQSKAGIAIARVQTTERISERKERINEVKVKKSGKNILPFHKILQLRDQAEVHCNVTEQEKIPCNPVISPCLFNVKTDPCEMINIIAQQPSVAASLKRALLKYRLTMVPPSNKISDLQANPIYWNNTWTCWQDSQQNKIVTSTYLNMFIAIASIVFVFFIIAGITLGSNLCRSTNGRTI